MFKRLLHLPHEKITFPSFVLGQLFCRNSKLKQVDYSTKQFTQLGRLAKLRVYKNETYFTAIFNVRQEEKIRKRTYMLVLESQKNRDSLRVCLYNTDRFHVAYVNTLLHGDNILKTTRETLSLVLALMFCHHSIA